MNPPIQWLLIGGPGHGKTGWVKAGANVLYPGPRGKLATRYQGENVHSEGRLYRVGRCGLPIPEGAETCVYSLIRSTKLEPIA